MKQNLLNLFLVKQDYLAIKARCANQQYINGLVLFRNYKHSLNGDVIFNFVIKWIKPNKIIWICSRVKTGTIQILIWFNIFQNLNNDRDNHLSIKHTHYVRYSSVLDIVGIMI
jgi:hypothetical protein